MNTEVSKNPRASASEGVKQANTAARPGKPRITKRQQLIQILSSKTGKDVPAIGRKLGWQPHTVRAALTGLRKAGFVIDLEQGADGKPGRYRIACAPDAKKRS